MLDRTKVYLTDLAERTIWTAAQAFVAVLIASGFFDVQGVTDTSILGKAGVAGIAAALAVLKGVAAKWVGDSNSASTSTAVQNEPHPV